MYVIFLVLSGNENKDNEWKIVLWYLWHLLKLKITPFTNSSYLWNSQSMFDKNRNIFQKTNEGTCFLNYSLQFKIFFSIFILNQLNYYLQNNILEELKLKKKYYSKILFCVTFLTMYIRFTFLNYEKLFKPKTFIHEWCNWDKNLQKYNSEKRWNLRRRPWKKMQISV